MLDPNIEKELLQKYKALVGIDEAGRGPWAGPLVVAGVMFSKDSTIIEGINDSKKLTERKRENLYNQIIKIHPYHIVVVESIIIDEIGIGKAVINAMNEVIKALNAGFNIIDGYFKAGSFPLNSECIIDGDALCYSIAAASILAKYTRDQIMIELDKQYPEYDFKSHKGYGTKLHMEKLKMHGASPVHRMSYKPIKNLFDICT